MVNVIWVVEDLEHIRKGLEQILSRYYPHKIVTFKNGGEVLDYEGKSPDVVILDLGLPDMDGISLLLALKCRFVKVKILIYTIYDDTNHLFDALKYGADGYILKGNMHESIIENINDIIQGGAPMSRSIAKKVFDSFHQSAGAIQTLSKKEDQVLHFLTQGLMYKEIAEMMFISINTVKNHIKSIYTKLQVHNSREAVIKYIQNR